TVEAYLAGEGGYLTIAKKHGVPSESNIRKWVRIYLKYGRKGLEGKKKNKKYPVQFKVSVIEYKLRTGESFNNIALHFDIPRSEEHTSELQSRFDLVCRLLLEKKKKV